MVQLRLKNLQKSFGSSQVIRNFDLEVLSEEFLVLVGPSGCGKSTILRIIAGLETPTSGSVYIDQRDVNTIGPKARGIAMVFQNYALYPHMTVHANIAFSMRLSKIPREEIDRRVRDAARMLGVEAHLSKKPAQLSGGQKQRVAIGRAIVRKPQLFLFDEPLSNLDMQLRGEMRAEISALHRKMATTTIYVTHDQVEAMTLADRIAVINEGCIEQIGRPLELYKSPATQFVAGFIGSPPMNFLAARALPPTLCPYGCVTIGFRPDRSAFSKRFDAQYEVARGHVRLIEPLGAKGHVHVSLSDGQKIVSEQSTRDLPRIGDEVSVYIDPDSLYFFAKDQRTIVKDERFL